MSRIQRSSLEFWLKKWLDPGEKIRFTDFAGNTKVWPDWTTGDRTISEHLIYFVTRSAMAGTIAGKPFHAGPGTFVWIPSQVRHHLVAEGKNPFTVRFFRFGFGDQKKYLCGNWKPLVLTNAWPLEVLVSDAVRLHTARTANDPLRECELRSLVALLLIRAKAFGAPGPTGLGNAQIERLEAFVEKNVAGPPNPAELAAHLGLSADYFSRIFRRTFGRSPKRWLMEKRIHRANLLLGESALRVAEVSELLGYSDVRLFTKQFKSVFGLSPGRKKRDAHR